ncbi:MAG: caspase family protein [Xenococcaceae cyanobacterium MO_188.B32]|nr:caspase family protein [Xenococcaceae cyanobacterium MO_188.B32]
MRLNRRTFLQQAGVTLFTLGISETGIGILGKQGKWQSSIQPYLQTLAQTTNRKLALLVGINQYSANNNLDGCITDVELQRELLIHRFGFQPEDVLTLTARQATREKIETAFIEHLGKQAQAGDVIVFHFSGYGSQVKVPSKSAQESEQSASSVNNLVNSLVPVDGIVSSKDISVANYLSQETLYWLGRSLATDKLTIILDTSFSPTPKLYRGNLKIRSLKQIADSFSSQELAFLEQLKAELGNNLFGFNSNNSSVPGTILSAAGENQVAAEYKGNGFSAGLFTYALTQYLWQVTSASKVQITRQKTGEKVEYLLGTQQKPTLTGKNKPLFTYYLMPISTVSAEGVVINKEDKNTLALKLTGLPLKVIDNYGVNSCFCLVPLDSSSMATPTEESEQEKMNAPVTPLSSSTWLQIRGRDGLTAKAQLLNQEVSSKDIEIGQLVQEVIRVFPQELGLVMAFAPSLERIERVDATSAFANVAAVDDVAIRGEKNADYLLGKVAKQPETESESTEEADASQKEQKKESAYGLFSFSGDILPKTVGVADEAVKLAVKRLTPQLNSLLAAKWLDLTVNQGSSLLGVNVALESIESHYTLLAEKTTFRASTNKAKSSKNLAKTNNLDSVLPVVADGSQLQFRINNYEDRPLYLMLLGLDADGDAIALLNPQKAENPENPNQINNIAIAPKQELIIPTPENSVGWKVSSSAGIAKVYSIFATAPFTETNLALSTKQNLKLEKEQVINIINSLEVTKALLKDLHQASAVSSEIVGSNTNIYALDVRNWATISFAYEVV